MKRVFTVPGRVHGNSRVEFQWQRKVGNYLATAGENRVVNIWDRNGELFKEIDLEGNCTGLDWSKDGNLLAVIHNKNADVIIWNSSRETTSRLDTGEKAALTFLKWSSIGMTLAIGTAKGTLVLYNHTTSRKIPVYSKHGNKPITCGAWSSENQLCLGGGDKTCTISSDGGSTLQQLPLHFDPSDIAFHESGPDANGDTETTVSILLQRKTLYLWSSSDPDNPIELEFQAKYGNIVAYEWFGDKKVLIGFSSGHFIIVSTIMDHIGQELFQSKNHRTRLNHICVSEALNKAASCGDDQVKIHDLTDPSDMYGIIELPDDRGMLDRMNWSEDGQLLTISTMSGMVYTYLTKLPVLGAACGTRICNLTALKEMTISDPGNPDEPKMKVTIPVEPSFVSVGPYHAAAGLNNQAYFFVVAEDATVQRLNREPRTYLSTIEKLAMNAAYAAVLTDGRLQLHLIEGDDGNLDDDRDSILFPTPDQDAGRITSFGLTPTFCVYATGTGVILYFMLEDWKVLSVFRHVCGVKLIAPDPSGARVVFVDDKGDTLLFNPVNDAVLEVPDAPLSAKGILWDQQAPGEGCFIVYDDQIINTYVYRADHYMSPKVEKIGTMERAHGIVPVTLINGVMVCITPSGRTAEETLETHTDIVRIGAFKSHPKSCALQNTVIGRFHEALVAAYNAGDDEVWDVLYKASLRALDIPTARKCAQARGDPAASAALASIEHIEDSNLLSGHVALILGETELAEKMFLASSAPSEALQMHRDLLNWEMAMQLAEKDAPREIPYISREFAQQLEFQSAFGKALSLYEQGITGKPGDERHDNMCRAGMARMMIRNGDISAGKRLAEDLNVRQLWRDCAQILNHLGQYAEAAQMYKQGDQPDKAGGMYIRMKNWAKVEELLPQMQSSKLVVKYARAREQEGAYGEAAKAYEQAGEFDAVIRISLDHLSNPDEAVRIVKKTGSVEGAKLVAKFFMNLPGGGDPGSAIQFLVMSGASDDAFQLAHKHDKMDVYSGQLGDGGSPGDYKSIAVYYEKQDNFVEAGQYYFKAGEFDKALALLLKANDPDNRHIDLAIEVIGKAQSEQLMDKLIDYVMGEVDGSPKDAKYLFKSYIAMKQYTEAARTAVIIAREDQMSGEYRKAHGVLFEMYRTLETQGVRIPMEMQKNLMILHSYLMVKVHIKRQDHLTATRLLLRVAENISLFPSHVVNILTTTVIECWKTGLKSSGFGYAAMLTRPEYRPKLDPKYKPKIEKIARSFRKEKDDVDEEMVPSPFDPDAKVQAFVLMCPSTSNVIPYCVVTGRVMQIDDWTKMPCCGFPALNSAITGMADESASVSCPMCSESVMLSAIKQESEPSAKALLRKFNQAASTLDQGSSNA